MRSVLPLCLAGLAVWLCGVPLEAGIVSVDGGWTNDSFGAVGSFNDAGAWTFSSVSSTKLTVVDLYMSGDQFAVYDNESLLGLTSVPTLDDYSYDPDAALTNSNFSSGMWTLAAGSHSVTFEAVLSPYGNGGMAFRVDTAGGSVPEPCSLVIWALCGGAGLLTYRRQKFAA